MTVDDVIDVLLSGGVVYWSSRAYPVVLDERSGKVYVTCTFSRLYSPLVHADAGKCFTGPVWERSEADGFR